MACGCGKARMARPLSANTITPQPSAQRTTSEAQVIASSSPYNRQQSFAPAHLQDKIASNARRKV